MRLFPGLIAVIAVASAADAAPNVAAEIGLCAAKTDANARLACYDTIAAKLKAGEAVATPATQPAPVPAHVAPAVQPESQFGAEAIRKEERAAAGQPEQIDEIHGAISQLSFTPNGRAIFTLSNGQVWRQIDGDTTRFRGKEGDKATIARALLGSYSLTVEGRNLLVKVQRVR